VVEPPEDSKEFAQLRGWEMYWRRDPGGSTTG